MESAQICIAVEAMLLRDLAMDACMLASVQLALDRFRPRRLLYALPVLCIGSILCMICDLDAARMHLLLCPVAALLLIGSVPPSLPVKAAAVLLLAYAAAGGCAQLFGGITPLLFLSLIIFALLLRRQLHPSCRWNIGLRVEKNGRTAYLSALIDTGNRLSCRRGALSVVIAQEDAIKMLTEVIPDRDYVSLPYSVIGSGGELQSFYPDSVHILLDGRSIPAPECMVAVSPGLIPGCINALAPPVFAQYTCTQRSLHQRINHTYRRFQYGFFKHKAIHLWSGRADSQRLGVLYRRQ